MPDPAILPLTELPSVVPNTAQVIVNPESGNNTHDGDFALYIQIDLVEDQSIEFIIDTGLLESTPDEQTQIEPANIIQFLADSAFLSATRSTNDTGLIEFEDLESAQSRYNSQVGYEKQLANLLQTDALLGAINGSKQTQPLGGGQEFNSIAQQAVNALNSEFAPFQQTASQSVTIEIDPPELGRINIHVEVVADKISAQIIASEWVSAELLSRDKNLLVDSLSEFGFGQTSVDVSHGSMNNDQQTGTDEDNILPFEFPGAPGENEGKRFSGETVVLVGVNLVA